LAHGSRRSHGLFNRRHGASGVEMDGIVIFGEEQREARGLNVKADGKVACG